MDLHFTADEPSAEEIAGVDAVLGPPTSGWLGGPRNHAADGRTAATGHQIRSQRHLLLPVLRGIQSRIGWISPGALDYACRRLDIPPAEAYGVADFYALLSTQPRTPIVAHVCGDVACLARGAETICEALPKNPAGEGTSWLRSPCLGLCERAPAALVSATGPHPTEQVIAPADAASIQAALADAPTRQGPPDHFQAAATAPQTASVDASSLRLLGRVGRVNPESLADYRDNGGYSALDKALSLGPEQVVQQISDSGLAGRGGAAFPTGVKWKAVAEAPAPRYLVCNADESEPGTFKDRVLMEADPFAVVEAMTIAGFATGCERAYLYIRGEYPLATERMAHAVAEARRADLLGANVLAREVRFDIEIRSGAGAYICGEETALFNSIEGYRGEPRNKPPYPTQSGLFSRPTLVNNVETLVNVPLIVLEGGASYASTGSERSSGPKLFCLSGHVQRPGVYEVEFGSTARELIELAGGVGGSGRLQAVLLGGAAGGFLAPEELDLPLTFEGARAAGASLGSAVVMLFDDTVDLRRIVLRIARFFRDESCGQCVPCRVGTARQEELLQRLSRNAPIGSRQQELTLLDEINQVMRDGSICGLGHTASSAVVSALSRWPLFDTPEQSS